MQLSSESGSGCRGRIDHSNSAITTYLVVPETSSDKLAEAHCIVPISSQYLCVRKQIGPADSVRRSNCKGEYRADARFMIHGIIL